MEALLGYWVIDPTDQASIQTYGRHVLIFDSHGQLTMSFAENDKVQAILLTYRVEDDILIMDQPSAPREERTPFVVTADDQLFITREGIVARYVRTEPLGGSDA